MVHTVLRVRSNQINDVDKPDGQAHAPYISEDDGKVPMTLVSAEEVANVAKHAPDRGKAYARMPSSLDKLTQRKAVQRKRQPREKSNPEKEMQLDQGHASIPETDQML